MMTDISAAEKWHENLSMVPECTTRRRRHYHQSVRHATTGIYWFKRRTKDGNVEDIEGGQVSSIDSFVSLIFASYSGIFYLASGHELLSFLSFASTCPTPSKKPFSSGTSVLMKGWWWFWRKKFRAMFFFVREPFPGEKSEQGIVLTDFVHRSKFRL